MSNGSPWSEERLVLGARLWAEGHRAGYIARQIGVTRNAFLGKAHRLNWQRGTPLVPTPGPKVKPSAKGKPRVAKPKPERTVPVKPKWGYRLMDLTPTTCRWPVGGSGASTLFCGDAVATDSVYCEEHRGKGIGQGHSPRIRVPA